jgi:5-methylcytosine-specific restriction endonuclease McrA
MPCKKVYCSRTRTGAGNVFWGRTHTKESKDAISIHRKGQCLGHHNGLGYQHTEQAKDRIAEASRVLWREQREKMIACLPRGETHPFYLPPHLRLHRKGRTGYRYPRFSKRQRREWLGAFCVQCGSAERLELDHVHPVSLMGQNTRENAQTLCRRCHRWKTTHVDLPQFYAKQEAAKGA